MSLSNKVAIVSGVSKGIGNEMVKQLLSKGVVVLGLGKTQPNITNSRFHFESADIRYFEQVENACNKLFRKVYMYKYIRFQWIISHSVLS